MTRAGVTKALKLARVSKLDEDANGVLVRRAGYVSDRPDFALREQRVWRKVAASFGTWINETWRIYSGGGIAGNGDAWWMHRVGEGAAPSGPLGPYTAQRSLAQALRAWREFEVP